MPPDPVTSSRLPVHRGGARLALGLSVALLAWSTLAPTRVLAWTRAQVRGAQAHVDIRDADTALIALRLRVHIGGGWLTELELPGLPSNIVFDADKPVTLVADSGEKYVPAMVLRRGVWRLTFATKHQAPWRGDYTLTLLYRQPLETDAGSNGATIHAHWTMPPWRMGMEDARIWISGPPGLASPATDDQGGATSQRTHTLKGRVLITHHRTQLPRDTEWTVDFDVPSQGAGVATHSPKTTSGTARGAGTDAVTGLAHLSGGVWLPWLVLMFAMLKARSARSLAAQHRCIARALFPWPSVALRCVLSVGLAAAAQVWWSTQPWLAAASLATVVLLAIDRAFLMPAAESLRWAPMVVATPAPRVWTRLRASVAPQRWLDATTPIGGTVLMALLVSLAWLARLAPQQGPTLALMAVLIAPLWTTATRLHLPWQGARIAQALGAWCARHRPQLDAHGATAGTALVCVDDQGRDRDARLPLQLDPMITGLRSVDLALVTDARSLRKDVAMLVHTETGSAADAALTALTLSVRRVQRAAAVHVVGSAHIFANLAAMRAGADDASNAHDRAAA